ncbi:hypothetical protein [Nocardia sp. NPDC057227]|uniref:hypothetical protein n=1 Tax=Nocardia sp. NPDC057227 TaxID=3346056 RepID=UPI003634ED6D
MIITAIVVTVIGLIRRARSGDEPSRIGKAVAGRWSSVRGYAAPALAVTLPAVALGGTLALAC